MIRGFALGEEAGAVSADWLALGAGAVVLAVLIVTSVSEGTSALGTSSGTALGNAQVTSLGTVGWRD